MPDNIYCPIDFPCAAVLCYDSCAREEALRMREREGSARTTLEEVPRLSVYVSGNGRNTHGVLTDFPEISIFTSV